MVFPLPFGKPQGLVLAGMAFQQFKVVWKAACSLIAFGRFFLFSVSPVHVWKAVGYTLQAVRFPHYTVVFRGENIWDLHSCHKRGASYSMGGWLSYLPGDKIIGVCVLSGDFCFGLGCLGVRVTNVDPVKVIFTDSLTWIVNSSMSSFF